MKKYNISVSVVLFIISALLLNLNKMLFFLILFIGLHEIGHLITIKLLKYDIYKFHILPFGLMIECNMNKNRRLLDDILVYISGIAVNIILIIIFILFKANKYYIYLNLGIVLFNIIPIIPLDGGRILLSLLSIKIRYKKVLLISSYISFICIIILIVLGVIYKELNIILISVYLLIYNVKNYSHMKSLFNDFLLGKYLYPNFYLNYHYVKMDEIGVENNFFKGKNNIFINKNNRYYEKNILKKKYKDKKTLS
ncbi:MAG: site-2 protease family protein [Anaeroplasmataceae bacterium]